MTENINLTQDVSSLDYLMGCIQKWEEANKGKGKMVEFYGSFIVFNEDFDIIEDRLLAFGFKDTLIITIEDMAKAFINEEEDFINW